MGGKGECEKAAVAGWGEAAATDTVGLVLPGKGQKTASHSPKLKRTSVYHSSGYSAQ